MPFIPMLFLPGLVAIPQAAPDFLEVRVDRRFELMSIVFRLANFQEYTHGAIADYNCAVDAHFGPFKDHPAVAMARELRPEVGYDAIPHLAILTKDAVNFEPICDAKTMESALDTRWKPETARRFLVLMTAFAKDAKAEAFFAAQAPFYDRLTRDCREALLKPLDRNWFTRTFGPRDRDTFILCVAPLNGGGNYGPAAPNAGGGRDLYAFMGTNQAENGRMPSFDARGLPILVHEFLHSFANPWVERHITELRDAGESLNAPVIERMRQQAYGDGPIALKESMVRAFTIRYFQEHSDTKIAESEQQMHAQRGFYWVSPLAELLGEYTSSRDRFPTLEAFTPRLVAAFKGWATRAKELREASDSAEQARQEKAYAEGPQLLSIEPANSAKDVDPTTTALRIRSDRPMGKGMAMVNTGELDIVDKGTWDSGKRTLTFAIRLKPATTYSFWVNHPQCIGFMDTQDRPLRPTQVTFTTR